MGCACVGVCVCDLVCMFEAVCEIVFRCVSVCVCVGVCLWFSVHVCWDVLVSVCECEGCVCVHVWVLGGWGCVCDSMCVCPCGCWECRGVRVGGMSERSEGLDPAPVAASGSPEAHVSPHLAAELEFVEITIIVVVVMVMVVVITCLLSHYKLSARSFIGRHSQGRRREDALSSVSAQPLPSAP